ncbi:MAG: GatB/YqeY domain-containing protein [Anaerolineales bacterium]|nr:GatB/YqeY domain-containing protein [Anaerolineales bacterium]MCB9127344.1 GatB/YqeY domain-containing protein [Ardenticatenales bacterium]
MTIRSRMREDLKAAMKARDRVTMTTLRTLIAALDNAEALPMDDETMVRATLETLERMSRERADIERDSHWVGALGLSNDLPRQTLTDADEQRILQREAAERRAARNDYQRLGRDDQVAQLDRELEIVEGYLATE